jgi:hypothetical protein
VTVPEGHENNLLSIKCVTDFHAWCVDEKKLIHDYPISQNGRETEHWTETVIRRPWDVEHVIKAFPEIKRLWENSIHYIKLVKPLTLQEKLSKIANNTFPQGQCFDRALAIRDSDPKRFSLVIGSLGFVQPDGTFFWEFG